MDKLEKAANDYSDSYYSDAEYPSEIRDIFNDCKSAFKAGAKWQKNNMWIDVEKDGYPEYKESYSMLNNKYIVIVECQNMYLNKAVTISSLTSHSHFNVEMNSNTAVIKVTHWMPIPKLVK